MFKISKSNVTRIVFYYLLKISCSISYQPQDCWLLHRNRNLHNHLQQTTFNRTEGLYVICYKNYRKFVPPPSPALGCYWLYKNYQPIGVTVHSHCVESFEGLLQRCRRGRGCSELWIKTQFFFNILYHHSYHIEAATREFSKFCCLHIQGVQEKLCFLQFTTTPPSPTSL